MKSGKKKFFKELGRDLVRHKSLYLMLIPVILYYLVFCYYPMYGAQIAFRDYSPKLGSSPSPGQG